MCNNQVLVILTSATFSLLTKFTKVLRIKFLKKINKKTTYKTFTKKLSLSPPPCFMLIVSWLPVHTKSKIAFTKIFCFILLNMFFYPTYKNNKRQTYIDLICSEWTLFCCLNLCPLSTTWYRKNIPKKRPEIISSKGREYS